ncbi:armadillo-type protein [Scleroderma citrinum]
MQSLLRWSVENSTPNQGDTPQRKDIDPGIIDHILGKPDAQLMKESLEVAVDPSNDENVRLTALDDLEMLVENIDNANDLKKLNMWEPLHGLLSADNTTDPLKMQTLWVIGTALQNNPAAQLAYLNLDPLPAILSTLTPSSNSAKTRSKAMYALSGLLKHNAQAVRQLNTTAGWHTIRGALEDSDIAVRRKAVFLLNSLLMPTCGETVNASAQIHTPHSANAPVYPNSHASMVSDPESVSTTTATMEALRWESRTDSSSLMDALVSALVDPVPFGPDGECEKDTEFQENLVRLLHTFSVQCNGKFSDTQRHALRGFFSGAEATSDEFGLSREEFEALKNAI